MPERVLTCAHCRKDFPFSGRRRRSSREDEIAREANRAEKEGIVPPARPRLVKCPHCFWKFEVAFEEGESDGPLVPHPGRFNV